MKNLINTKEVEEVISPKYDPFDWENYCGNCDYFGDSKRCPFFNHVWEDTRWKDIGCENYWD